MLLPHRRRPSHSRMNHFPNLNLSGQKRPGKEPIAHFGSSVSSAISVNGRTQQFHWFTHTASYVAGPPPPLVILLVSKIATDGKSLEGCIPSTHAYLLQSLASSTFMLFLPRSCFLPSIYPYLSSSKYTSTHLCFH